jgi:cellulose synthase/poly-beta-1,6-N-acetylglucosamine synthase-like glycosyltransferase
MDWLQNLLLVVLAGSATGVLLVFGLYPLVVACASLLARRRREEAGRPVTSVSVLVALRNAEALAEEKVKNSLELAFPGELQLVFVSDGSTDATAERLCAAGGGRIEVLELAEHLGKAAALNVGAERCRGEILVFSDADALLAPDAVAQLVQRFADPSVGGVCGQRVIREQGGELTAAQGRYISADSALKRAESRVGSVTSNDGKLYAIRRELFRPIAPGATDDLYACLEVVEQGRRFVFEPRARAFIRTPSRNPGHELLRRRRIVARSLRGIFLKRELLNPLRHGLFAVQLLINKVFRRCLPLFLVGLLVSSLALGFLQPWAWGVCLALLAFGALALSHRWVSRSGLPLLGGAASVAYYFCVGNLGTLLGLADFLRRRETVKWDPIKAD